MKKALVGITSFLCFLSVIYAQHFWRGPTMAIEDVAKRWGKAELKSEEFKKGTEPVRAAMAYSLLKKQKDFVGKPLEEIRRTFGDPNGFYFSDIFPAYIIQRAKTTSEEAWQIVFLLDKSYKVEKVIVHKSCCDQIK